jgi:hypothetical protein
MRRLDFSGGEALQTKLRDILQKVGKANVVKVGFLEGATYPDEDHTPVAMVAAIQNFGAPGAGIPARPFFSNMVREKSPTWGKSLGAIAVSNAYDMKKTLSQIGAGITSQLQASIVEFNSVPLSDATIARKGFSKQLIDTAHMQNSVDYEVGK